jgi:hypothetical protein
MLSHFPGTPTHILPATRSVSCDHNLLANSSTKQTDEHNIYLLQTHNGFVHDTNEEKILKLCQQP